MISIENKVAQIEQSINWIDWIPVASYTSGALRFIAGAIEVATATIFSYLKVIYIALLGGRKYEYRRAIFEGLNYSLHGLGNMLRGSIAMVSGVNLLLCFYDYKIGRMNYEKEFVKPGVYPLMTAYKL